MERETGLEPATFSLEGLGVLAQKRSSWKGEHFVSSYRVVRTPTTKGTQCEKRSIEESTDETMRTVPWRSNMF